MTRPETTVSEMAKALDELGRSPLSFLNSHPRTKTTLIGMAGVTLLATALIPVRDSVGTANIALAMALIVGVVGSADGMAPGLTTAAWAAAAFALLHAVPHGLPRLEDEQDVLTAALLLATGIATGWLHRRRVALQNRLVNAGYGLARLHRVAEAAIGGTPPREIIDIACEEISAELDLQDCFWEAGPATKARPELRHNGVIAGQSTGDADAGEITAEGVVIDAGAEGRFVLIGRRHCAPSRRQLKVAVIVADVAATATLKAETP